MTTQIVTANRLGDGAVVYLSADGRWTETVGCARVANGSDEADGLLGIAGQAVADGLIVEPYLIPVTVENGVVHPVHIKEVIRANGPTTRLDLGKQASTQTAAA